MNALPAAQLVDNPIPAGTSVLAGSYPGLTFGETLLELTLPTGWMLRDGAGCRLAVVCGCLWLTDERGEDLWLKAGDSVLLTPRTLLTAECDTVVQIRSGVAPVNDWQSRLQVNARQQRIELQVNALSFWQRCGDLLHAHTLFRQPGRSNTNHERH